MNDVISELCNGFAAPKKLERERELLNCGFIDNLRAPEVHVKGATA